MRHPAWLIQQTSLQFTAVMLLKQKCQSVSGPDPIARKAMRLRLTAAGDQTTAVHAKGSHRFPTVGALRINRSCLLGRFINLPGKMFSHVPISNVFFDCLWVALIGRAVATGTRQPET